MDEVSSKSKNLAQLNTSAGIEQNPGKVQKTSEKTNVPKKVPNKRFNFYKSYS